MSKTFNIVLFAIFVFSGCQMVQSDRVQTKTTPVAQTPVVDETTNIHYTGKFCNECHERTPVKGGQIYLKFGGDYQQLCRCHHGMSPGYCHPLDIKFEKGNKLNLPSDLPLSDGKMTCNTCHDVYKQCQKQLFDRQSLRGAPYEWETDFCYRCHDRKTYQKLNAHHQVQTDGTLNARMCLYCHRKKPDEKTATYKDVTFIGDMRALCRRCHDIEGNHPGNFDHMAKKPSTDGLKRMEAMIEKYDIILPLAPDGKMTCITCHNPHEKGTIAADKPAAKGADSKYRERVPGKMCIECHQK